MKQITLITTQQIILNNIQLHLLILIFQFMQVITDLDKKVLWQYHLKN